MTVLESQNDWRDGRNSADKERRKEIMIRFKKIRVGIKKRLPFLAERFRRDKRIIAFYLFGSYAKDSVKPLSDIDAAVLLRKNIPASAYWDLKVNFVTDAMNVLKTEEVDFVILNEAQPELKFNILKYGKILFCRDEKERQSFQEETIRDYLDTQYLRDENSFHLQERIKDGRFAYDKRGYK